MKLRVLLRVLTLCSPVIQYISILAAGNNFQSISPPPLMHNTWKNFQMIISSTPATFMQWWTLQYLLGAGGEERNCLPKIHKNFYILGSGTSAPFAFPNVHHYIHVTSNKIKFTIN